eukprot:TRINITY_DN5041_c0_g1_i23.p1 TRINITY_DN5041_c0_g1~~TRINITY_DN5041_c0_g1_i23.p1  ORF type:complete len:226 (+),score=52.91 TRINITY_DN5041_c0_g1_i23:545-1222(+)
MTESFLEIDKQLQTEEGKMELSEIHAELGIESESLLEPDFPDSVGCTACAALVSPEEVIVANSGDSRCVLSKSGVAVNLSEDHKPELESEKTRIELAGGYIEDNRVNGIISLTRSLGDFRYKKNLDLPTHKQLIIAKPDVQIIKIQEDCEFMMIACDGIWDCMSSQRAVDYIREQIAKHQFFKPKNAKLSRIIEQLFDKNIAGSVEASNIGRDNMTCILVRFKHP